MDEQRIRAKIQHKLQLELLPHDMGSLIVSGGGGSDQICAACAEAIKPSDVTPVAYKYTSGKTFWFHKLCEEIWQAERFRLTRVN